MKPILPVSISLNKNTWKNHLYANPFIITLNLTQNFSYLQHIHPKSIESDTNFIYQIYTIENILDVLNIENLFNQNFT